MGPAVSTTGSQPLIAGAPRGDLSEQGLAGTRMDEQAALFRRDALAPNWMAGRCWSISGWGLRVDATPWPTLGSGQEYRNPTQRLIGIH
jgi:hypothetical protein